MYTDIHMYVCMYAFTYVRMSLPICNYVCMHARGQAGR